MSDFSMNRVTDDVAVPARQQPVREDRGEKQRQRQRFRLMRAAAQTFADRGYANSSVAHVLKRAGMSRRSFYELFDSKEDILVSIVDLGRHLGATMRTTLAGVHDPLERIDQMIALYLTLGVEDFPRVGYQVMAAGARPREVRARYIEQVCEALQGAADDAAVAGQLPEAPTPLAIRTLVNGIDVLVLDHHAEGRAHELAALVPEIQRLVRTALRAPLPDDDG